MTLQCKHIFICLLIGCDLTFGASKNAKPQFSKRISNFSFSLLYQTGREMEDHLVMSPFQVWSVLAVLSQGAGGASYKQLHDALNLPRSKLELYNGYQNISRLVAAVDSDGVKINSATYIFVDSAFPLEQNFTQIASTRFNTKLHSIDFKKADAAANEVNTLISRETGGKIEKAFDPEDFQDAQLILSSAIHFEGTWTTPFESAETMPAPFYDEKGAPAGEVNMMYMRAPLRYATIDSLNGSVLELPYGQDVQYSMLILLPKFEVPVVEMFRNFEKVDFSHIFSRIDEDQLNFEGDELECWLPRFKITTDVVLNAPLNALGIFDLFEESAELRGVSARGLRVARVTQKAVVEVTERGTSAAGVASAVLPNRITPSQFKADRPFVYLVLERTTSTILFGGFYSKPSLF